ncbi:HelD family protein, partial [Leucobacter sp. M11]|uniref:HelD family protein n=1 Tax=Leucobacter sp. M11 TaxID=2993565 RepID=UPI002D7FAD83
MLSTEAAQAHLDELRSVVDTLLARERGLIEERLLESGTATELWERDAQIAHHQESLSRLLDANEGLLFGHLETDEAHEDEGVAESWYIGRMGLTDPVSHEVRLVDWRAPVARPFYTATPLHPEGVRVRTHIETSRWRVLRTSPERLTAGDGEEIADGGLLPTSLLAAMDRSRSGHMNDIVATIQVEQDRIIRSELPGTLLVQGGPGTGKTAVALHRAAYLLYEHRDRLERNGVLLVGPNSAFLDYIGQVLPSLGETSVVLTTIGTLLPGIDASRPEDPVIAELKGRLGMSDLLRGALDRAQVPAKGALDLTLETGELVTIPETELGRMRKRVRQRRRPHNAARPDFERVFTGAIARSLVQARTAQGSPLSFVDGTEQELAADLLLDPAIEGAIDALWPRLSPGDLVSAAYAGPEGGLRATQHFSRDDRAALHEAELLRREHASTGLAWSEADVPALDEAWELLGED